ncbi:hypothetical protein [Synechococcus sp. KORDI-52]|uniref:hypothetical protein n=1 Tax=Synechococcus sp. KORDI-52 TaxID=585425 RepID=UPI000AA36A5E|nr:hypothetical protein [Synechococcus sp. KORDI-52]
MPFLPPRYEEGAISTGLALTTATVTGVALLATLTGAQYGNRTIVRQNLSNGARAAAEAGASSILAEMNSMYPYLLVVEDGDWGNPPINSSLCDGNSTTGIPTKNGNVSSSGSFELIDYNFIGNPIFGGTAIIRVKGSATNNNSFITATTIVEQKVQIVPKNCKSSLNSPNVDGFPGLWAQYMTMGNNDVYGSSGNILCSQCTNNIPSDCSVDNDTSIRDYSENDKRCVIGGSNNMVVGGEIYLGSADFPLVPRVPDNLKGVNAANINSNTTIVSGSTKSSELLNGSCVVTNGTTQCKVNEVNLTGNRQLIIDTSNGGPVQIFVVGDGVSLKGRSKIEHIPLTESAAKVGLFGNPIDTNDNNDQTVALKGKTKINNIWTYFPDGKIGISGGGNVSYSCASGDCSGGNFHGAVWAKEWGLSDSNVARITIPINMGEELEEYYPEFRVGNKTFVAAGTTGFRTLNMNSF